MVIARHDLKSRTQNNKVRKKNKRKYRYSGEFIYSLWYVVLTDKILWGDGNFARFVSGQNKGTSLAGHNKK